MKKKKKDILIGISDKNGIPEYLGNVREVAVYERSSDDGGSFYKVETIFLDEEE